jgi:hypothetical protein
MTSGISSVVVAAVMAIILSVFLQLILLITNWLEGMSLYRWMWFALTCWISLMHGSYTLVLYGNYMTKKAHENKQRTTDKER